VKENVIRFGLHAVKNAGLHAVESIIEARKDKGKFTSLFDFCKRVDSRAVNKKVIESLIKVGAFDSFGHKRSALLSILDKAVEMAQDFQKDSLQGQLSFFDRKENSFDINIDKYIPDINEWPKEELLKFEKSLLGFYISGHPLEDYRGILDKYSTVNSEDILSLPEGSDVIIGGLISSLKKRVTRGDSQRMAIAVLEDLCSAIPVVFFPEIYQKKIHLILEGNIVFVKGKFTLRGEEQQVVASDVILASEAPFKFSTTAVIELDTSSDIESKVDSLVKIINKYKGDTPLKIVCREERGDVVLESAHRIGITEELLKEVKDKLDIEVRLH
ncbi:MAG: hypothetical protein PHQ54_02180, partial [Candidatus Omnitrophica bacterium]|nr:hypothetical protein [Candidatus Omnitrophota bacterium]